MGLEAGMLQNVALVATTIVVLAIAWKVLAITHRAAHGRGDDSPEDLLAEFEAAYGAGEMDSAEFRRVRAALDRKAIGEGSAPLRPETPSLEDPRLDAPAASDPPGRPSP